MPTKDKLDYELEKLIDTFDDIYANNSNDYTPYLKSALPPFKLERINAFFIEQGKPYVIKKHHENHKVWIRLRIKNKERG